MSPRQGEWEICVPVDLAGGPAALTPEQWDLYMEFYGWDDQWEDSELRRKGKSLPADLIATYEAHLLTAAGEVLAQDDSDALQSSAATTG